MDEEVSGLSPCRGQHVCCQRFILIISQKYTAFIKILLLASELSELHHFYLYRSFIQSLFSNTTVCFLIWLSPMLLRTGEMEKVFFLNRFIMSNEWGGCWRTHTTNTHPLSFTGNWEDYKYFFEGTRHRRELKYREIEKQESKSKIREVFAYSFHAQGLKNIMHGLLVVLPEDDTCTIYVSLSLSL